MEISGKVIKILPLQSGEGKNGHWQKQEFVIEVPGSFPKKVCFSLWGDRVSQYPLKEGESVTLNFDLESREFNNRWYTEARVWKVSSSIQENNAPADKSPSGNVSDALSSLTDDDIPGNDNFTSKDLIADDDLPF